MKKVFNILERCINLTFEIIDVSQELKKFHHYEFASQIIRSASAIGANLTEAQAARTKIEFRSINGIALKEARETIYWLVIIERLEIIPSQKITELKKESREVANIIGAIILSSKNRNKYRN